jgi:hypothetical protein
VGSVFVLAPQSGNGSNQKGPTGLGLKANAFADFGAEAFYVKQLNDVIPTEPVFN